MLRAGLRALWLALVLGGCATTAPVPSVAGRCALSGQLDLAGAHRHSRPMSKACRGRIHWQHREQSDELLLTSPLGQGVARIERQRRRCVMLDMPNQPARHAADAESLTRETLGYALPVAGLVWWVQARPAPERAFEATRDAAGRLAQLKQDGWVIDYLQYAADMPARPRKLVVAREGLEIRLVADSWTSRMSHAYPAPAKLNLFLHVVGRRADGYHLLQSVFRLIDRADTVHLELRDDGRVVREGDLPGVAEDDDLTVRAARLLQTYAPEGAGVSIRLEKILPLGGGLGGGSSDAATVLLALNRLWQVNLSRETLQELALATGRRCAGVRVRPDRLCRRGGRNSAVR